MKAVRQHQAGGAETLVYEDAPAPVAGKGQMVVRVRAAGVNPIDFKLRGAPAASWPRTLGFDVAGVVESVGEGVASFKPGDEVFAYLSLQRGGGYAERAIVLESEAATKPAKVGFEEAGATPLVALTAWQALVDKGELKAGQTVLIHGGAGGVGHMAVQIAKHLGARVIATASEKNAAFVKELGADVVIDYKAQKFEDIAKDVDVVLDPIGGETQERSIGVLKRGGVLVSIVQPPAADKCKERGVRGLVMLVQPNGKQLAEIARLIDEGKIRPVVSERFPLAEAAKAQGVLESGANSRGKIVLTVK